MKKDITIIIPVYNVEKYIERCINSLLNQTIQNFNILLIDDGSKDNSLSIIKKYASEYDFINYIHQKNSGPAIARNNGMKKADTKYIMFIDSDDYVDEDYIEFFYNNIKNTDYDVVMGGFKKTDGNKIHFERKLNNGEFSKYLVTGPVAKIYNRYFLKKKKIEFLDTNSSEDVYFTLKIINNNAKIKTIDYIGYYYFDNLNSISNTSQKGFNPEIKVLELLDEINYKNSPNIELNQYYIIRYCIWYLLYSGKNVNKKLFLLEYKKMFGWLEKNVPNYKKNKNIKFNGPLGEDKSVGRIIFIFMILHKLHMVGLFAKFYCKGE